MGKRRVRARRGGGGSAAPGVEKLINLGAAAEVLGMHERTLQRLCMRGKIRHQRFGRRVIRLKPSDLADYIKSNTFGGGSK